MESASYRALALKELELSETKDFDYHIARAQVFATLAVAAATAALPYRP